MTDAAALRAHRRATRRLTLSLLALWFCVSFAIPWFSHDLGFRFFGWSFAYWMSAQGSLLVYCFIAAFYAWRMNRLDRRFGVEP